LGVELRSKNVSVCYHRRKVESIVRLTYSNFRVCRRHVVAMHKIEETVVGHAFPERVRSYLPHAVPAHVRNLEHFVRSSRFLVESRAPEPQDLAGENAQRGDIGGLFAHLEQHLHADAYAQQWFGTGCFDHRIGEAVTTQ